MKINKLNQGKSRKLNADNPVSRLEDYLDKLVDDGVITGWDRSSKFFPDDATSQESYELSLPRSKFAFGIKVDYHAMNPFDCLISPIGDGFIPKSVLNSSFCHYSDYAKFKKAVTEVIRVNI